jgi:serine/threonine-protein kinase
MHEHDPPRLSPTEVIDRTAVASGDTLAEAAVERTRPSAEPRPVNTNDTVPLEQAPFERRYELRALLGAGGMGEVRVCRDHLIGREVAFKVVRAGAGSSPPGMLSRFLREARIQGQLEHPAVVPVYDLGVGPDGAAYFTMKRVRGMTLAEILRALSFGDPECTQRYSRRKLLTAFSSVCLAVDFAHSRGVLHRDLKPSNVMLGDFGEVYLLDWGLARLASSADLPARPGDPPLIDAPLDAGARSVDGTLMGTPGYMAPEQVRGDRALDARTDVYALGCILFELLTLEPLHRRESAPALIASTLMGVDARPSVRDPTRALPPELDAICVRATTRDPAERFPSARALHEAIERFLDGDRDLELRRQLAAAHAAAASEAAERAVSEAADAHDERKRAMTEVGQALALDPQNSAAMKTMVRLLLEPPREIPAAARAELERSAVRQSRLAARVGGVGYFLLFLFIPLFLWMGIRDWTVAAITLLLGGAAIGCSLAVARLNEPTPRLQFMVLFLSTAAIISTSRMFGPYLLLPSVAAVNTIGFAITPARSRRMVFMIFGCLTVIIPVVLEWAEIWPRSYVFRDGVMMVVPQTFGLPETPTMLLLLLCSLAVIIGGAYFVGRIRDALTGAEERLQLHAWQLRHLIPDEARGLVERPSQDSGRR